MDYLDESAPDPSYAPRTGEGPSGAPGLGGCATNGSLPPSVGAGDLFARAGDWAQALRVYQGLWAASNRTVESQAGDSPAGRTWEHGALENQPWDQPETGNDPGHLSLARRVADSLEHLGRYQEAARFLAPILAMTVPEDLLDLEERQELGRCRHVLGKAYFGAGQMAQAEAEARQAANLLANTATPEPGNVQNLLSGIAYRRGDMAQAESHLRCAVDHFRRRGDLADLALSYMNLGHLYKQRCEWARSLDYYQTAYYLRATEGEFRDQGGILRNLALVLMKLGRFEEASEKLEASLKDSIQMADPVRTLRTRLALARLARESWQLEEARSQLAQCRLAWPDPVPEREGCLLLLEEAHVARLEEKVEEAQVLTGLLRLRVERLASRGDLMIEALLLEGMLEMDRGNVETSADWFQQALELSREDRDRFQEHRALFGQAELAIRRKDGAEAERILDLLESRFVRGNELPFLARVMAARGRLELQVRSDPQKGLVWHTRSRDLWRRMARPRAVALAEMTLAETLCDLGRPVEAGGILRELKEREDGDPLSLAQIAGGLERLEERIRTAREAERGASPEPVEKQQERVPSSRIDGGLAYHRLQDILTSEMSRGERLHAVLALLVEALAADGGLLARTDALAGLERPKSERGEPDKNPPDRSRSAPAGVPCGISSLEVVSTLSMGRLQGRRVVPASHLGLSERASLPCILTGLRSDAAKPDGADTARPDTAGPELPDQVRAMVLPVLLHGRAHVLHLERRGVEAFPFTRSDLDYGTVLLAEAARGLRPASPEDVADSELSQIQRRIWLADVVTQNKRMLGILELIRKVGDSDMTVLLQGETGTGKKLMAQAIHRTSARSVHPFVTVDCAALTDSLLESELFGHRKGAFTGAVQDRVGLLEEANGGTIFLDEIDKAGLTVQRRFLHMLDSGEVRPVGATGYRTLNVRVVCATSSPDLRQEVEAGRFLKDLYYRLNDISIVVPPLRERSEDVPLLAEFFIDRFAEKLGREVAGVAPTFHAALAAHSWPGNVRELEKAIGRAVTLLENGGTLTTDLLPAAVLESCVSQGDGVGTSLRERLERYERGLILEVLDRHSWNRTRSAQELGLSRKGLKSKIQRYRLDRRQSRRT